LNHHPYNYVLKGSHDTNTNKMFRSYTKGTIELKPINISIGNSALDNSRRRVATPDGVVQTTQPLYVIGDNLTEKKDYIPIYKEIESKFFIENLNQNFRKFFYKKIFFRE